MFDLHVGLVVCNCHRIGFHFLFLTIIYTSDVWSDGSVRASGVNLVWNLGGRRPGSKKFRFSKKISEKFRFFQSGNFTNKKSIFQGKFPKHFAIFQVISQKSSIFQGKFPKNFDLLGNLKKLRFSRKISEKFRFFQAISQRNRFFGAKFRQISILFSAISQKISIFQPKIGYLGLQLFLGKLFYFSSKVTTFEHTSCTW